MIDTRMSRGVLAGCQRRVNNLESKSIFVTLMKAFIRGAIVFLGTTAILATDFLYQEDWWQNEEIISK